MMISEDKGNGKFLGISNLASLDDRKLYLKHVSW